MSDTEQLRNKLRYEANLEHDSLGALLVKIYNYRVPGLIEAKKDDVNKRLFLRDGNVIYATSTDPRDRLGSYLLEKGILSTQDLEQIARDRASSKERAGVLMIRAGLISPLELREAIRNQIELIAWSLFSWRRGLVAFDIREQQERNAIRIQIPLRHMIFGGMRDHSRPIDWLERLGGEDKIYEPIWDGEELIDIGLNADEFALLREVDGKKTLGELLVGWELERDATTRLLAGFEVLKLIRLKRDSMKTTGLTIRLKTAGGKFS